MDPALLALIGVLMGGSLLKFVEKLIWVRQRREEERVSLAQAWTEYEPTDTDIWNAREIIRKLSPALAMRLDYSFPVEKPKPVVVRAAQETPSMITMYKRETYADTTAAIVKKFTEEPQKPIILPSSPACKDSFYAPEYGDRCDHCEYTYGDVQERAVAKMHVRRNLYDNTYELLTTSKDKNGDVQAYAQRLTEQMLASYSIPTNNSGPW
jgi:hypothetical protein